MHRIGRTGRADKSGIAISLVSPSEVESKIEVELLMNTEIKEFATSRRFKNRRTLFRLRKRKEKNEILVENT